jgi:hypothetical protein
VDERQDPRLLDKAIDVADAELEALLLHSGNEAGEILDAELNGNVHIGRQPRSSPHLYRLCPEEIPTLAALRHHARKSGEKVSERVFGRHA